MQVQDSWFPGFSENKTKPQNVLFVQSFQDLKASDEAAEFGKFSILGHPQFFLPPLVESLRSDGCGNFQVTLQKSSWRQLKEPVLITGGSLVFHLCDMFGIYLCILMTLYRRELFSA